MFQFIYKIDCILYSIQCIQYFIYTIKLMISYFKKNKIQKQCLDNYNNIILLFLPKYIHKLYNSINFRINFVHKFIKNISEINCILCFNLFTKYIVYCIVYIVYNISYIQLN